MCPASFKSLPNDKSDIDLPDDLRELVEGLAENRENVASPKRKKPYDRDTAVETLKAVLKLGYQLVSPADATRHPEGGSSASLGLPSMDQISSLDLSGLIALWQARTPGGWSNPKVYRHLGQTILKLGEPLLAYDVLTEGLMNSPMDVRLRQLLALALARSGATLRANVMLMQLREEGHRDEETLGILARTHKDLWAQAATPAERKRQLGLAHKFYAEAYKISGGYYSGINAATLGLLLGKKDRACALAREVRQACLNELARLPKTDAQRYWPLATLGETALILRRWSEAKVRYAEAAEMARGHFAELSSTRRNARLILDYHGRDRKDIESCFQIPKVVVFAGHMIDRADRQTPRFPPELEPAVREAIRLRLKKIGSCVGYSSAACGSDILFLETLIENGCEAHVVLPYNVKQFMKDSVTIVPHTNWGARFKEVLTRANEVTTASKQRIDEGSMSFEYTNLLLQGLAQMKARQLETPVVPLAVWDQRVGDGLGGTASMMEHWQKRALTVELIDLAEILSHERPGLAGKQSTLPAAAPKRGSGSGRSPTRLMALLFADAVNFSKLTERQNPLFVQRFLGAVAALIAASPNAPVVKNTWGDGIYLVFESVQAAGECALELCDLMNQTQWQERGLPAALNLRIALHVGPVYSGKDPITDQVNCFGSHVSQAARIEPITPPGQVYASQSFAALAAVEVVRNFTCDYVGQTPLAKSYGTFPTYHVGRI